MNADGFEINNPSLSAEDIDRDLTTNCPAGTAMYGFGNNMSTTLCRKAGGVENGTGYVNFGTVNASDIIEKIRRISNPNRGEWNNKTPRPPP